MFKVDERGWARIECGKFKDRVSYLTDVPTELINKAISFMESGTAQAISFNGDGKDFTLMFDNSGVYIIKRSPKLKTEKLGINSLDLIIEIFKDINYHTSEWIKRFYGVLLMTKGEEEWYRMYLKTRLMILFGLLEEKSDLKGTDYCWKN